MPKKTFTPEQIVAKLRQVEVLLSQGKTVVRPHSALGYRAPAPLSWITAD